MRGCESGLSDDARRLVHRSKLQTKTKRACDDCAKAKTKCDGKEPCDRCRRKGIQCQKTRNGYEDPYTIYAIQHPTTVDGTVDTSPSGVEGLNKNGNPTDSELNYAAPQIGRPAWQSDATCQDREMDIPQSGTPNDNVPVLPPDKDFDVDRVLGDYNLADDEEFWSKPGAATNYFPSIGGLDYLFNPHNQHPFVSSPVVLPPVQPAPAFIADGFSLARLDPIAAKCSQIIDLLKESEVPDSEGSSYVYITRDNLVRTCHHYGKHFQHNLPIIHSPSFNVLESPPILLLAVMLVGSCYTENSIPPAQVTKLAMRLLSVIGSQPASSNS